MRVCKSRRFVPAASETPGDIERRRRDEKRPRGEPLIGAGIFNVCKRGDRCLNTALQEPLKSRSKDKSNLGGKQPVWMLVSVPALNDSMSRGSRQPQEPPGAPSPHRAGDFNHRAFHRFPTAH